MQVSEGLGQLEAYILAEEGVAFEMDNKLIWDSMSVQYLPAIHGQPEKMLSSKLWVDFVPSGKVTLHDWLGMYLGVMPAGEDPSYFPVLCVPFSKDVALEFEVFNKDNKVAFRAYNGLFLATVFRDFYTIAAINTVADDSCCFRPMIGDVVIPTFEPRALIDIDFSRVTLKTCELKTDTFFNTSNIPKALIISMSWEATLVDRIAWKRQWGLGLANSWEFGINGMTVSLEYTEDNEKVVFVTRNVSERHRTQVMVPPQSICTARLLAERSDNAAITFTALIHKVKPNGDVVIMHEPCAWTGVFYRDINLVYKIWQFPKSCTIM